MNRVSAWRRVCVETWLIHESGATMQFSPLTMPLGDRKPQTVGSALTYARRYALGAICGLAPDDDDAEAAQASAQNAPKATQKGKTPLASEKAQDNPFEEPKPVYATTEQLKTLNGLGNEFYQEEWTEQLPNLVAAVTKKSEHPTTKPEEMSRAQAERLIDGIKKKMNEVATPA
jgi:hypothetical protein